MEEGEERRRAEGKSRCFEGSLRAGGLMVTSDACIILGSVSFSCEVPHGQRRYTHAEKQGRFFVDV